MDEAEQKECSATETLKQIYDVLRAPSEHSGSGSGERDPLDDLPGAVTAIAESRPRDALQHIYEQFYTFPFSELPEKWMLAYEDVSWRYARSLVRDRLGSVSRASMVPETGPEEEADWLDEIVRLLDRVIIMTGAKRRIGHIHRVMDFISSHLDSCEWHSRRQEDVDVEARPAKRQKVDQEKSMNARPSLPSAWPASAIRYPRLTRAVTQIDRASFERFEKHVRTATNAGGDGPGPVVITNAICHWPALDPGMPSRSWSNPQNLLRATLGGRRLAPVETGRSYMDEDFGQKIMPIGRFFEDYMLRPDDLQAKGMAYLAQHDLLRQIPQLRSDIAIPDYCYADVSSPREDEDGEMGEPLMNAWFGPAGTITPLHRDNYHNVFAQVVGHKYIRLFPPSQESRLHPADVDENGVNISNTSRVDVGVAMHVFEGWDWNADGEADDDGRVESASEVMSSFADEFASFADAEFLEVVLGPGDCLYVPFGWWHYVRSLSTSFSVSFWW